MHPALHSIQADVVRSDRMTAAKLARTFTADGSEWPSSGIPTPDEGGAEPTDHVRRRR